MINLYTGLPGSGKSLTATDIILARLSMRCRVIINFDVKYLEHLEEKKNELDIWDNEIITIDKFVDFANRHHIKDGKCCVEKTPTLVVLDECQLLYGGFKLTPEENEKWLSFFAQHRKYGFDFLLITQHLNLIDLGIRKIIDFEVNHIKR